MVTAAITPRAPVSRALDVTASHTCWLGAVSCRRDAHRGQPHLVPAERGVYPNGGPRQKKQDDRRQTVNATKNVSPP